GSVDPTLLIRRNGNDLLLVQIYVDDIIFAASTLELCDLFANLMCSKFKMSMIGKISFFLGLQISQNSRGIFINQSKYALESLKKYDFESCDPVDTLMVEKSKLDEDREGKPMINHIIVARPTEKHVLAVKRFFRYLCGTVNRGLWYPKDSSIALTAFADADHVGCQDTHRSTSGNINHVAKITGYGDYQIGNVMISRAYYVEGLGHNLFFVGQFCDSDLEVAFRQHTCFIRNLEGVDLLTGSRGNNLYTLSLQDMMASSPIWSGTRSSEA
nr:hypothetical protein [Tanacetum cinerariifolium]